MDNEKKCDKYEAFFVFQDEEAFNEHLKNCPDCQKEHEKYLKVSELVKEIAPLYLEKREKASYNNIKRLACCLLVFFGLTAFTGYKIYDNQMYNYSLTEESCISMQGLPVDDYGFLEI